MRLIIALFKLLHDIQQPTDADERADKAKNEAYWQQQETDRLAFRVQALEHHQNAKEQEDSTREQEHRRLERSRGEREVVGLVVLIFYTLFTAWLAFTASDSATIARDSLESVQRAFVVLGSTSNKHIIVNTEKGQQGFFHLTALWENGGTTPATSVVQRFAVEELPNTPTEDQFIGPPAKRSPTYIGPKGHLNSNEIRKEDSFFFGDAMPGPAFDFKKDLTRIKPASNRAVFFWGWIGYRDVFQKSSPHVTEFCHNSPRQ